MVIFPPLTITFLGTGTSSGIPMIGCDCEVCVSGDFRDKRLRCSVLIESANTTLVVDAGPDFRHQMLRAGVKKLDAILITHPHKDHIAGLDDVRAYNFFYKTPMPVYANSLTEEALRRDYYYAFSDTKYPGVPEIDLQTITMDSFWVGDIYITPILVWHLKMPVLGFRFGAFTYITDANRIEDVEKEKIRGSQVLVVNALRNEKHISHFTLREAIHLIQELEVPTGYFIHMSHQLGKHALINEQLPVGMQLAYDGLQIEV
jgi:phosphoribosyl 1,2-cyclic phosphate phosphodiesterase